MNYFLKQGIKPEKLILHTPLYGNTFTLKDPYYTNFGSLTETSGSSEEFPVGGSYVPFREVTLPNILCVFNCGVWSNYF